MPGKISQVLDWLADLETKLGPGRCPGNED